MAGSSLLAQNVTCAAPHVAHREQLSLGGKLCRTGGRLRGLTERVGYARCGRPVERRTKNQASS
eukprot:3612849-Pleurochrysis_carterae.AAC.1